MFRTTAAGLLAGALLFTAAACGDDAADPAAAPPATADVSTVPAATSAGSTTSTTSSAAPDRTAPPASTAAGTQPGTTTAADPAPAAIVSLSPTATETLYAIGAADQVLAVDDFSNYPPEAASKMVGLNAFEPSVEAIAGLEPDLVVTDGTNPALLEQLDGLGIAHWEGFAPATLDAAIDQIEDLGHAVGRPDEAVEVAADIRAELDAALADLPVPAEPLTYYHELDNTHFSVTSESFVGAVYDLFGLTNIADAAGAGTAYPQLSAEFIIEADPDLIFLACTKYCGETAESVAARPGWDAIAAVRNGGVIEMDDDIASRWGPRIVDYVDAVSAAVREQAALEPVG